MNIRKLPPFAKILIGMLVGVFVGWIAHPLAFTQAVNDWIAPLGTLFLRLLKLVAIPLVLVSLIKGVGGLNEVGRLASMGLRTIGLYLFTTLCAILIGIALTLILRPGELGNHSITEPTELLVPEVTNDASILERAVIVVPENLFLSLSDNSNILQIIVVALLIGIALALIGKEKNAPLMALIDSSNEVLLKLIDIIMSFAPIGVLALMADMIASSSGGLSLLGSLGAYAITVILGLLLLMFGFYPLLIRCLTDIKPTHFIRTLFPVQLVAISSSSSAATLPTTMKATDDGLKLSKRVSSFVLPIGVTINMDGTSCYQCIGVLFIAQFMGIDLSIAQLITIIAATTLSSIGTPGIPGGSIVISMMILTSVGLPPESLALILGIDRPLDMLRTAVNVTGDACVAAIVNQKEGEPSSD